jgi:hypothetical protein
MVHMSQRDDTQHHRVPKPAEADVRLVSDKIYPGMWRVVGLSGTFSDMVNKTRGLGLPLKVEQHRLGHSTIQMTADIYGRLFPNGDDGAELAAAQKALLGYGPWPTKRKLPCSFGRSPTSLASTENTKVSGSRLATTKASQLAFKTEAKAQPSNVGAKRPRGN